MPTESTDVPPLRLAIIGAGFWAQYQVAAWQEIDGCRLVAVVDTRRDRAEAFARRFSIPAVYVDAEKMLQEVRPDAVDIITTIESHAELVKLAARYGVNASCQKPLADSVAIAQEMIDKCIASGTQLAVHENWRWQKPILALKQAIASNAIGDIFRARIEYCNSFPVFDNQPNLKELKRFIIADMGSHIFDTARFLFGEFQSAYCIASRSRQDIAGEDVATCILRSVKKYAVTCNLSYSSKLELDRFPETLVLVEGSMGSICLDADYWLSVTTEKGTLRRRHEPDHYAWADARYMLVHSSMVACERNIFSAFQNNWLADTCGSDNLKTMKIIDAAYESADSGQCVTISANDK